MRLHAISLSLLTLMGGAALADEGMWTFDNLPHEALKARYNFTADKAWVDHVQRAAVSLGGCSASFVSKSGLVMTNHHCIASCLQQISSPAKNYLLDGFLARKPEQEIQCPATEVSQLEQITDVTAKMQSATKGLEGEAYQKAQNALTAQLTSDCQGDNKATVRCSVVTLYQGGQYHLYRYQRYSDVRLVWAPEDAAPNFGGDPDNFNFPRFGLDSAMLRAYKDGKPAVVKDFFTFSAEGAKPDELVFTAGTPGRTNRLLTVAQLETLRDVTTINSIKRGYEFRGALTQFRKLGTEQARVAYNDLFFLENSMKVTSGNLLALQSPALMERKRAEEAALKKFVAGNPKLKAEIGDPWAAIAKAQLRMRDIGPEYEAMEGGRTFSTRYFSIARTLLRGAEERTKTDAERLPEFASSRQPFVERQLFSPAPIYPEFEKMKLEWSLTKLRETLGTDHPFVKQVLGSESPEQMAKRLIDGTKLGDVAVRKTLWAGDQEALAKADDPFIQLARTIDTAARAMRKRYEAEVTAVEKKNAELVAKARFAMLGTKTYPDATGTLRLSFGAVKGWTERGTPVPPFTDFAGAFARHTGAEPYALPKSWLESKDKINLAQNYNFVTTNDIIGGNSGSPMINAKAEIVGLAFDGNIHSHGGAFWSDPVLNRTVGVTSGGMLEALKSIYGATELINEIQGK
ncbi:MAG: serine protease [Burkholderiales bacterium PBB4]|nr:MAG: serine protease [Burkholderiales bacterium PBB4]